MRNKIQSFFGSILVGMILCVSFENSLSAQSPQQILREVQQQLETFSIDQVVLLPLLACELDEYEKKIHPLAYHQPIDSLWSVVFQRLNEEKKRLDQQLQHIDHHLLLAARRHYENHEYTQVEMLLERALTYHALSEEVLLFHTDYLLARHGLDTACRYLQRFAPQLRHRLGVQKKSQELYQQQLIHLEDLCRDQKYAQGMELIEKLQFFVAACPLEKRMTTQEESIRERLHKGQYHSLLNVALKAQKNGNPKLSEYYRLKAQEYQNAYRAYLPLIATSESLHSKGILSIYRGSDTVSKRPHASSVMSAATEVLASSSKPPQSTLPSDSSISVSQKPNPPRRAPKLRNTRQQLIFDQQLEQARLWTWKNRHDSALYYLERARLIDSLYIIQSDEPIECLWQRALKSLITRTLTQGQYCIWADQWEQADSLWHIAQQWIHSHHLQNDPNVEMEVAAFQKNLYNKRCQKNVSENRFLLIDARNRILSGQYLQASQLLWKILEDAKESDCPFSIGEVDALLEQIGPAVDYQKMLEQALYALECKDFEQFFVKYREAEVFYLQNNLDTFALRKVSLFDKLRFEKNLEYCLQALDYFGRNQLIEDFTKVEDLLKSWGYPMRQQKHMRKQLHQKNDHR